VKPSAFKLHLPLRFDSGERYTTATFSISIRSFSPIHRGSRCSARQAAQSYLYIQDCIDAILLAIERAADRVNIFNLGQDEYCEVNQSIGWICERLQLKPSWNIPEASAAGSATIRYLSGLQPDPRAGLDAETVDPQWCDQHPRISDRQSLGGGGADMTFASMACGTSAR